MSVFLEGIFPLIFFGYFFYIIFFLILIIPMTFQLIFLYLIKIKDLWKFGLTILVTEGLVISLSNLLFDLISAITSIYVDLSLDSLIFLILPILLLIFLIFLITRLMLHLFNEEKKQISYKQILLFLSSYIINIIIILFMISKFNLFR